MAKKQTVKTQESKTAKIVNPVKKWLLRLIGFVLIVSLVTLIFWLWKENIIGKFMDGAYGLLGWGIILIMIAIIVTLCILFRERLAPFAKRWTLNYWYRWLGGIVVGIIIWGVFGFSSLGGSVGKSIVGNNVFIGILRLLLLAIMAFVLLLPAIAWRLLKKMALAVKGLFKAPMRTPVDVSNAAEAKKFSNRQGNITSGSLVQNEKIAPSQQPRTGMLIASQETEKQLSKPAGKKSDIPQIGGNKQVAQDIWRKYGLSPNAVEVDGWKLPPIDLLDQSQELDFGDADNNKRAAIIEEALA
ncbi:MAG: hypothetical protein FWH42_02010, partial [Dehalococcoidia bacterium]|nr:hypothetical protein [Dehalococcoidia bacterium]